MDLPGVDLGDGLFPAGVERQPHLLLFGDRVEHVDRLADDAPQVERRLARRARPGEIEKLTDDPGHLVGLELDGRGTLDDLLRIELAGADQPRPAGDDVQRRAEFMGDARGQAADDSQAVGVAKLLQGRDPRGGLLPQPGLGFGQLRAHAH